MLQVRLPKTAVEWSDDHFYLSGESSSIAGRWSTLPFQVGMLNAMGNSDVQRVDVFKSARVGFTKLMQCALGYFLAEKRRSVAFWQPTDGDRDEFVKSEVDPAIRDVPAWRKAFPDFGKKSKHNTLEYKAHVGASAWFKGGTSAKNFRRISPDVAMLDEIDAFDADIDGEGDAVSLAWKRCEVSSFRKLIVGSSPKEKGTSQIEKAAESADAYLRFHVPCPHCGEEQPLVFGAKGSKSGLKWEEGDPASVRYVCRGCEEGFPNSVLSKISENGLWRDPNSGFETRDGLTWLKDGEAVRAPRHVAFHIWSAYSPFTTWREIIEDWLSAKSDPLKLKTFVNTTLGETWEVDAGEKISKAKLSSRVETYDEELPSANIVVVTAGVDVQPDRFEVEWIGWAPGQEAWVLGYQIFAAQTDQLESWEEVLRPKLFRTFKRDGRELETEAVGIDTGGSATQVAYDYCKKYVSDNHLALKGFDGARPIMPLRPATNWKKKGLEGWAVGVDTAKAQIFDMLKRHEGGPASFHFPDEGLPDDYFDQLTVERKILTVNKKTGRHSVSWKKPQGARNEALDVTVYSIAALEFLKRQRYLDLDERFASLQSEGGGDGWDEVY